MTRNILTHFESGGSLLDYPLHISFFTANDKLNLTINDNFKNPTWEIFVTGSIDWFSYIQYCESLFLLACFHITSVKLFREHSSLSCPAVFTSDSVIVGVSLFCWYDSYLMGVNCKAKSGLTAAACVSYSRIIAATRDPLNPPTVRLTGKPTCSQSSRWIFTLLTQSTATWPSEVKTNTAFPVPDVEGLFWIGSQMPVLV